MRAFHAAKLFGAVLNTSITTTIHMAVWCICYILGAPIIFTGDGGRWASGVLLNTIRSPRRLPSICLLFCCCLSRTCRHIATTEYWAGTSPSDCCMNATLVWYGMGRAGLLPHPCVAEVVGWFGVCNKYAIYQHWLHHTPRPSLNQNTRPREKKIWRCQGQASGELNAQPTTYSFLLLTLVL
jgi:hypothetical protein